MDGPFSRAIMTIDLFENSAILSGIPPFRPTYVRTEFVASGF